MPRPNRKANRELSLATPKLYLANWVGGASQSANHNNNSSMQPGSASEWK